MNSWFWRKLLPHIIAVTVFALIAFIYCKPAFYSKVVDQLDIQGWKGMAQQSFEFKEKYGHMPYWTNSMFGGMPTYQIAFETPNKFPVQNIHNYLFTLGLPKPANFLFLACIMMYFLLIVLRVNPWIGIMGALAYAYSTYDPIIIAVGHDTKMICIGYAPAVLGSLLLIFRKQYFIGTILMSLSAALILSFNHFQIIYYTLVTGIAFSASFVIHYYKTGEWKHIINSAGLALIALVAAIGVNIVSIWPTYEFAKETMRGGHSELSDHTGESNKSNGGLDKDYAFGWSYGINETFTFLVPGIYGGGSSGDQLKVGKSHFADKLFESGVPKEEAGEIANQNAYWGPQPGTSGPVYLGAIICFLFILGTMIVKNWLKGGIIAACIFALILAWGKNLPGINYFLFDHMPLYNKFRAPSMALVIPQLGFVMLACLALQELFFKNIDKAALWKKTIAACNITLLIFALLLFMYKGFNYNSNYDLSTKQQFASDVLHLSTHGKAPTIELQQQANKSATLAIIALREDRKDLFGRDLLRSFLYVFFAIAIIALYLKSRLTTDIALTALILLGSTDLVLTASRYLNYDSFVSSKDFVSVFIPTPADIKIKSDPDKYFRVFDKTANNPFADSRASYFHNSIGGYNPARLAYYNDIIQNQLLTGNTHVFNMLNTKYYLITNPATKEPEAKLNPDAYGNAWFVKGIRFVNNADEEMKVLSTLNLRDSAVVDSRYKNIVNAQPLIDSTASIHLIENINDKVLYKSSAVTNQFAVLSEVYYSSGWNAYVDGKEAAYCRVNYVLRGLPVPSGNHTIEFRFEPRSVILGNKISTCFSVLLYLTLILTVVLAIRKAVRVF